jgi:hypothetical protein
MASSTGIRRSTASRLRAQLNNRTLFLKMPPIAVIRSTGPSRAMRVHRWLIGVALALAAGPTIAGSSGCRPEITGSRALHQALSLRAVELVRLAADQDDGHLALIAPSANFSLGAGDVDRPLGTGVAGARQLAQTMKADTYRFLGWDYMDGPADACAKHKVEVEFIDSQAKFLSRVEFTFEAGRVVNAVGWQRSFETGFITNAPAD